MTRPALWLVALPFLVACADPDPTAPSHEQPQFSLEAAASGGCAEGPSIAREDVAPGAPGDLNGNGVICVKDEGAPDFPLPVRYDDLPTA